MKFIKDPIYDEYLHFEKKILPFIDNHVFKRLKNIKQLGALHAVFPSATHNRFEHSLGVAHLGESFIEQLYTNSHPSYKNNTIVQCVKLAGLYHDLGHGPFSHIFDHHVLSTLCPNNPYKDHETRSCLLVEHIFSHLTEHTQLSPDMHITGYDIDMIKNMIHPTHNEHIYYNSIIANNVNSIDVDKIDYLRRDAYHIGFDIQFNYKRIMNKVKLINRQIVYNSQVCNDIFDMYYTRYKLHREIYNHIKVKSVELMIADILLNSNDIYNYCSRLDNIDFLELTDTIIENIRYTKEKSPEISKSKQLIQNIDNRLFYKCIYKNNTNDTNDRQCAIDFIEDKYSDRKTDDFTITEVTLNLCNGSDNPLNKVAFYTNKQPDIVCDHSELLTQQILPSQCEETLLLIYDINQQ
jgi:deoxynucleoside triphosphate triphosphohydrolase SAMHD1